MVSRGKYLGIFAALLMAASLASAQVGASKLAGPASIGVPTCVASFNGSYSPLNASCL